MAGKMELGISFYPDFYSKEDCKKRLDLAKSLGYTRVFTSIQLGNLGFENTKDNVDDVFKFMFSYTKEIGIKCHVDINNQVLSDLGASFDNLKAVYDLDIPIIRIDGGFNSEEIAVMTTNPYGIIIEDNLSNYSKVLETVSVVEEKGDLSKYQACHNFFPLNETGLDMASASEIAREVRSYGVKTGAFICSLESKNDLNNVGHGVPTIEKHRYLPCEVQLAEFILEDAFDFILFGDSNPSQLELEAVANSNKTILEVMSKEQYDRLEKSEQEFILNKACIELPVYLEDLDSKTLEVLDNTVFISRLDRASLMIRGCQSRGLMVKPERNYERNKYMITLCNDLANRYSGELHLMLEDLPSSSYENIIGVVRPYARDLVSGLHKGEVAFKLKRK